MVKVPMDIRIEYSLRFLNEVVPTRLASYFLVHSSCLKRQQFQNGLVLLNLTL
jgi:hypothetical protein